MKSKGQFKAHYQELQQKWFSNWKSSTEILIEKQIEDNNNTRACYISKIKHEYKGKHIWTLNDYTININTETTKGTYHTRLRNNFDEKEQWL